MNFTGNTPNIPPLEVVATVLWQIWKNRNDRIFRGTIPSARNTVQLARILQLNTQKWSFQDTKDKKKRQLPSPQIWVAQVEGVFKINVNGSLGEGSTDGVIARIYRDHSGCLVRGLIKSVRASSPAMVETIALLEALSFVERNRYKEVLVESDRLDLISVLNTADQFSWEARALITECSTRLSKLPHVRLVFCPGSANVVADWAARAHRRKELPKKLACFPPRNLWALLCNDAPALGSAC
ncbi:hypothetical protein ACJRO7_006315 [Eucalyptus globulus]|uniref:RNase H type-1 domain-containing protein n=1 Tax=Eucalyptus globulus TaxID=34317 RepID=A0ABD3IIF4_EUCGL